jgi:hypothetical protein
MDIKIERNLEKSYELAQQEWKNKSIKPIIYLCILAIIGIPIVFTKNYAQNADGEYTYFSVVIGTIFITYALTSLRIHYAFKSIYFKDEKYKLLKHIAYLTTIKLTEEKAVVSNPEFTTTYSWEYFKYYKIVRKNIFISSKQKSLGIVIATDEISEKEQYDLLNLLNIKGIKRI